MMWEGEMLEEEKKLEERGEQAKNKERKIK